MVLDWLSISLSQISINWSLSKLSILNIQAGQMDFENLHIDLFN
jgi:hypothetical protein